MLRACVISLCSLLATALSSSAYSDRLKVVSFSTILTEICENVGAENVDVVGLVKPGQDPHEYQPTPKDLVELKDAKLILLSGKHIEHYLDRIQQAAKGNFQAVRVGDYLPSLHLPQDSKEGAHANSADLLEDPHWWHSITNVESATDIVRDQLIKLDPPHADQYRHNAAEYIKKLEDLAGWAKRKIAELPRDKRKLVTSHDAFQYFAKDYGFTIYAIEGLSTGTEPSNQQVAMLIDTIRQQHVKAIFLEDTLNPKITTEITRETGAKIGGTLYADGLGIGETGTYEGMFKHNVNTIVDALR